VAEYNLGKEEIVTNVLISLVGHQPLPTLILVRHFKPDKVILLSTNDKVIQSRKTNLLELISKEQSAIGKPIQTVPSLPSVSAWNTLNVIQWLENDFLPDETEPGDHLLYDVTGGTKAMAIGLARVASKRDGELMYVDSSGMETRLWCYTIMRDHIGHDIGLRGADQPKSLPRYLTIDDLFHAYLGSKVSISVKKQREPVTRGDFFEQAVLSGFLPLVDATRCSVQIHGNQEEIDIVLQKGNKFALVECKSGGLRDMEGIKQLNNLASDRYLGSYTAKVLAVAGVSDKTLVTIAKEHHNIHVLPLPNWVQGQSGSDIQLDEFPNAIKAAFDQ